MAAHLTKGWQELDRYQQCCPLLLKGTVDCPSSCQLCVSVHDVVCVQKATGQHMVRTTPEPRKVDANARWQICADHKESATLQDKENEHTPSTAYASSRLALASPAFLTPARSYHPTHPSHEVAVARSVPACPDAVAHSTPSVGTALTHVTPSVADAAHSTPTSEAGSGEAVLALRALVGASGRAHLRDPAQSDSSARHTPEQSDALARHRHHQPSAEVSNVCPLAMLSAAW